MNQKTNGFLLEVMIPELEVESIARNFMKTFLADLEGQEDPWVATIFADNHTIEPYETDKYAERFANGAVFTINVDETEPNGLDFCCAYEVTRSDLIKGLGMYLSEELREYGGWPAFDALDPDVANMVVQYAIFGECRWDRGEEVPQAVDPG